MNQAKAIAAMESGVLMAGEGRGREGGRVREGPGTV
jgi:hypothetical protein